jgi:flagellar biosynthesis anti-sigma factor FlgM
MDVRDRSSLIPPMGTLNTVAPRNTVVPSGVSGTPSSASDGNVARAADRSDVSAMARTLASAAEQPEVRQNRVTELQQQIVSGTYAVAPQDVANAMLRNLGS